MRIFCPEHGKGFFAPRQNPVRCENLSHTIGELDFEGQARTPAEARWEYCCNCAHFFLFDTSTEGIERCPACARQLFNRYLCDRCYLITCESNTPAQTKNFTLSKEGLPQPTCPGCLQSPTADVREHDCEGLGAAFVTALTSCPICEERLDVSPTFPAAVAYYLKRTRKKLNVTFDYATGLFCPAEDGEFVVVRNGSEVGQELMVPRMPSFATKRDFYDHYQDSFYCTNARDGEVRVIEPAIVERVENGWKLHASGVLEVTTNPATKKKNAVGLTKESAIKPEVSSRVVKPEDRPAPITTAVSGKPIEASLTRMEPEVYPTPIQAEISRPPIRTEGLVKPITTKASSMISCPHCKSVIESKYAFCWHCGSPTGSKMAVANRPFPDAYLEQPVNPLDEITISHEHQSIATGPLSIFGSALEEPAKPETNNRSTGKLVAAVIVGMVLVAALLFFMVQRSSSKASSEGTLSQKTNDQTQSALPAEPSGPDVQTAKSAPAVDIHSADAELQKIRAKRVSRRGSDREKILREIKTAETDYPHDYRFPYEQAKLSINPQDSHSHHEAFDAMMRAAQKAIDEGKANEMLASLMTDKDGDFYKLSKGHTEWKIVEQALRDKDKTKLHQ